MNENQVYHEDAVTYNEAMAEKAEELAATLDNPTVKGWCAGIGRLHRHHAKRHQGALRKMQETLKPEQVVEPARVKTISDEQAEYAAAQKNHEENNA